MNTKIKRHELWRLQYRSDRYMRGLSDQELRERFGDVTSNNVYLSDDGLISFEHSGEMEWTQKFTHLLEEFGSRDLPLPSHASIKERLRIPDRAGLALARQVRSRLVNGKLDRFMLFKYGKVEHLKPLLESGELRLLPASRYKDASLNPAIRDDELHFVKVRGFERTLYKLTSDFYCFCSAWFPNHRLVADFEADCVLIVREPQKFFLRLMQALDRHDYTAQWDRVQYIDPLLLDAHRPPERLGLIKHMRFAYQVEHRLVIRPSSGNELLADAHIKMGSLTDIAELCTAKGCD